MICTPRLYHAVVAKLVMAPIIRWGGSIKIPCTSANCLRAREDEIREAKTRTELLLATPRGEA